MRRIVVAVALVAILAVVNWSVYSREQHLAHGRSVYLELAPVDPRSLMQGDYMALRFRVADAVYAALAKTSAGARWRHDVAAPDGHAVVTLDERGIASFKAIHRGEALAGNEVLMRYRVRNGEVRFATNAWFFQEGHAAAYQDARYGRFRVDGSGELLLVAMHDAELSLLGTRQRVDGISPD